MQIVDKLINENKWPILNGITLPSGKLILLEVLFISSMPNIRVLVESTIDSYLMYNPEYFSYFDILASKEQDNIKVYVGEGSSGGDGIVLVKDSQKKEIKWVAFFDNSNPFVSVQIQQEQVLALNNEGLTWAFPVNSPQDLKVYKL